MTAIIVDGESSHNGQVIAASHQYLMSDDRHANGAPTDLSRIAPCSLRIAGVFLSQSGNRRDLIILLQSRAFRIVLELSIYSVPLNGEVREPNSMTTGMPGSIGQGIRHAP